MRSHSGDYLEVEREIWKPIHEEMIRQGAETGWSLWALVYPHGTAETYNYATANPRSTWSGMDTLSYADMVSAAHPDATMEEIGQRTEASRDLVRGEVWSLIASTTPVEDDE